ncbi:MAG: hypothetical protein WAW37_12940 [Syntrophobacteraceae bacterium]
MSKGKMSRLLFGEILVESALHFARACEDGLKCENCRDFEAGTCPGENRQGLEVIECMANKAMSTIQNEEKTERRSYAGH